MFCTQCGKEIIDDAKFCGHCGAPLEATDQKTLQEPNVVLSTTSPMPIQATASVAQIRPWIRYWARMFDLYLISIVSGIVSASSIQTRSASRLVINLINCSGLPYFLLGCSSNRYSFLQ
ncbi:MAG: zinc ribbon domain-containing protein [Gammaproteobacteria bacterium]|nr:MAG: zinc ribbon domain-containing protein [Gammaproteobacteria bacterium]